MQQKKNDEKIDPLTRIQEEIKEVVRREEEYRQLTTALSTPTPPPVQVEFENYTVVNGNGNSNNNNNDELEEEDQNQNVGVLVTAKPAAVQNTTTANELLLVVPLVDNSPSNTPSLASSVNSNSKEESLDEHHSDDSGISASSLSIKSIQNKLNNNVNGKTKYNNNSSNNSPIEPPLKLNIMTTTTAVRHEQRYIGPNCYSLTPEPPQQKLMTRTISTPQLNGAGLIQKRQFAFNGATKGVMQRFIASHGKVQLATGTLPLLNGTSTTNGLAVNGGSQTLKLNTRTAMAFLESGAGAGAGGAASGGSPPTINSTGTAVSPIERDSEGRPLRRGYVPVEQKIQRELQDLKSRETELKRLRKLNRQNLIKLSLDKLCSTDDEADGEADDDEDDEDSEVEHCYGPGKLRNAQSSADLDSSELEISYKTNRLQNASNGSGHSLANGMRPAMSLAQLCDLTPEEAPSSHRLIAQWESLIKKNAENSAIVEAAN